jgi:hypothetical protein
MISYPLHIFGVPWQFFAEKIFLIQDTPNEYREERHREENAPTTNRALAASPRAGAMHRNTWGAGRYAYGPVDTTGCPSSTRTVDAA